MHKFDAHRLIGLIVRYPKHKWHLEVWKMMWLKMHTDQCTQCQEKLDALLAKQPPKIGFRQEPN